MNAIFIAGTDTGVGKTVVTGLAARYLLDRGYSVVTQKWVQTGCRKNLGDVDKHLRLMGKRRKDYGAHLPSMTPYIFKFASSPHLAAGLDRRRLFAAKIRSSIRSLCRHFDFVIVEGTGGLLVPLGQRTLLIDLVERLKIPVLIVAGNRLGAINHVLLSLEALRSRKIKSLGVLFNNVSRACDRKILNDNPAIVRKISGARILGILPKLADTRRLQRLFTAAGDEIFRQFCLKARA